MAGDRRRPESISVEDSGVGARVLIVDDSRSMRQMVRAALEAAGHQVAEGEDGRAALALLEKAPVDLVVSDVNMPEMDGIALTRAIRQRPAHRFTPILILTTEHTDEMKQRGRAAGATGWLVKPFNPAQLRQVVERVLGPTRTGPRTDQGAAR
jgi:two-component system chemotaxis response regulator CheY